MGHRVKTPMFAHRCLPPHFLCTWKSLCQAYVKLTCASIDFFQEVWKASKNEVCIAKYISVLLQATTTAAMCFICRANSYLSSAGSADASEGNESQRGSGSQRGSQSQRDGQSHRRSEALMQPYQPETICRPTPIRAVESEPDLIRLAHSLMSLNPSRRLSPSDTSAFRTAEPIKQVAG